VLEIITLVMLSAILGSLIAIVAIIRHIKNNYSLHRRRVDFVYPDRKNYNLIIKQLDVISSTVRCKLCGDLIKSTNKFPLTRCSCGEVFVDGSHSHLIIGSKDLDNVEDVTTVGVRTISINRDAANHDHSTIS